jgi:hypothetical protein
VCGISLTADCAAVILLSLVTLLILAVPLIVPTVFHMLINGCIMRLKFTQSSDCVDDQSLGRSPVIFSGSCVVSHDVFEAGRSRDRSCDMVTCLFPGSRVVEVRPVFIA